MNKLILLLSILICMACTSIAQQPGLCNGYAAMVEESGNNFTMITGNNIAGVKGSKRWASKFEIGNAASCYIDSSSDGIAWFAAFGAFNSLVEAETKIKSLQSEFISCVPKMAFTKHINMQNFLPYYDFKDTIDGGIRFDQGQLGIYLADDKKYIPYLQIPAKAVAIVYGILTNEPDTTAFGKEMKRLLAASKNRFQDITGAPITNGLLSSTYKTTFCLTGAIACEIEHRLSGDKNYNVLAALNMPEADADKYLDNLSNSIASAIGKLYVWSKTTAGTMFTEASKAGITDNSVIRVIKEKGDGNTFNIVLIVKG
jgi:hypothetical protein